MTRSEPFCLQFAMGSWENQRSDPLMQKKFLSLRRDNVFRFTIMWKKQGISFMEVRFYNSNKDGSVDYVNDVVYYSDIVMVFAVLQKRENRLLLQQETVSVWFPM